MIWLYRLVDEYYPFANRSWNTGTLLLYALTHACDYANRQYPVWHTRLNAVGENLNVADKFALAEFAVAFLAGFSLAYWCLDTIVHPFGWLIVHVAAWAGNFVLARMWDRHLSRLRHATYGHVP